MNCFRAAEISTTHNPVLWWSPCWCVMSACLSRGKYPSETTVGFECQCYPFLPRAIPQIPLYPGDVLWMQLLLVSANIIVKAKKLQWVGDAKASTNSRGRVRLFLSQRVSLFRSKIRTCNKQGQIGRKIIPLCLVLYFLLGSDLYSIGSTGSY